MIIRHLGAFEMLKYVTRRMNLWRLDSDSVAEPDRTGVPMELESAMSSPVVLQKAV
jgi:hypothetical protein